MKTALQLKKEIIGQIWPSGSPENLTVTPDGSPSAFDLFFQEALAEVAKWVDGEQVNNTDVIPFSETSFFRAMTVLPSPAGIVRRVYTTLGTDRGYLDPVYYTQVDWPEAEWYSRPVLAYLKTLIPQPEVALLGMSPSNPSTDLGCGRARRGVFSIHNKRIYVSPWLQSNELVVIEWDGIKKQWGDGDLITETQEYKKPVKLYFQYCYERDFGDPQRAALLHTTAYGPRQGAFDEALAELAWYDRESRRVRGEPVPAVMGKFVDQETLNEGAAIAPGTVQGITSNASVDLSLPSSILSLPARTPPQDVLINLPNGDYVKQTHDFVVPANQSGTTERFVVSGRFSEGFNRLLFTTFGTNATVIWDGFAWHLVGGNAEQRKDT